MKAAGIFSDLLNRTYMGIEKLGGIVEIGAEAGLKLKLSALSYYVTY